MAPESGSKLAGTMLDEVVGLGGLEPPTSRLSSARSNQLSYKPLANSPAGAQSAPGQWPGLVHEERETKTAASRMLLADLRAISKSSDSRTRIRKPGAY